MKKQNMGKIAGLVVAVAIGMGASTSALGTLVDLATGNSGTINGANFNWVDSQTTGTGVIDPFSQLKQAGNNTSEASYNSPNNLNPPFDQHGALVQHNHDLLLSSVPIVGAFYQFFLDVGEPNNDSSLLSLNQLMVYRQTTPGSGGGVDANGRLTGFGTPVYDMNSVGSPTANSVLLDASRNPGNGAGDMFVYIPVANFAAGSGNYVVLYSQFGELGTLGRSASDGTFEEWSTLPVTTHLPEPTTMIAGVLLLLPFGASTIRLIRKTRTA